MSVLAIISFSFAVGVLLYVMALPMWASATVFTLAIVCGTILFLWRRGEKRRFSIIPVALAIGLLWSFAYEMWQIRPIEQLTGETVRIQLTAIEEEEKTDYGSRILCKYGDIRVLAYLFDTSDPIHVGDRILLEGALSPATKEDGLSYLAKDVKMTAKQDGRLEITPGEKTLRNLPPRLYGTVCRRILELFPDDTAPFALALLTGDTGELPYAFRNEMSLAGISHVVAVSGMHVSLICSLVLNLCLRRKRLAALFCLGAMWFFGAMLGFSPSVTRAVVMNSILLIAPILKREYDSPTALAVALLILLVKNPYSIASIGLQLSFGAVAGILLLTPPLCRSMQEPIPWRLRNRRILWGPYSFVTTSIATTMGASLFTVPLAAYYFGTVSPISFVSNLILLPVISMIFTLGYPLVIFSYIWYEGAVWVATYLSMPIRWVMGGIELMANVPNGALYSRSIYVILWLMATYGLIVLAAIFKRRWMALVLSVSMLATVPFLQKIHTEDFRFTMLDVGQGQCIVAEIGGTVAVIDCGGARKDSPGEEVARELLSHGRDHVDMLILTHYDLDHCGGVLHLMDRMEIGGLYLPDIFPEDERRAEILAKAAEKHIPIIWVREDLHLQLDGGSLDIFPPLTINRDNDGLCLLLSGAEYDILITGDLPVSGELELIQRVPLPDLELLIAGHHGAAGSTGRDLLEHTMPEELWISVGYNSYGHPDPRVLKRADDLSIRIRRTDQDGTITITR